ncbi:hypothetical protein EV182_003130 [Spiromyces aspiralis]|uniref:Uncharacterized protein n=1 Tax=Spiromyces aspiralis TaxID=68401 RepID=A0ACC1HHD2_9FUNG|nr:hypothetical protein EV182_003130 [Spiromyces aspiralis]
MASLESVQNRLKNIIAIPTSKDEAAGTQLQRQQQQQQQSDENTSTDVLLRPTTTRKFARCRQSVQEQKRASGVLVAELDELDQLKRQVGTIAAEMKSIAEMFRQLKTLYMELSTAECVKTLEEWKSRVDADTEMFKVERSAYYRRVQSELDEQFKVMERQHFESKRSNAEMAFKRSLDEYRQRPKKGNSEFYRSQSRHASTTNASSSSDGQSSSRVRREIKGLDDSSDEDGNNNRNDDKDGGVVTVIQDEDYNG